MSAYRVATEPEFINIKRFEYDLRRVEEKYPDGAPSKVIAAGMCVKEEEIEDHMKRITAELQRLMGVYAPGDE